MRDAARRRKPSKGAEGRRSRRRAATIAQAVCGVGSADVNCRCTVIAAIDDLSEVEPVYRRDNISGEPIADMSYAEWKAAKEAETRRRKVGTQGQEIIDKPLYNKLTQDFEKKGGVIIRGEEARKHLENVGAYTSYIVGRNLAFIRDDATVSDVLEEMHHAYQDRVKMFGNATSEEIMLKREIEAQKYLLSMTDRYNIPVKELEVTKHNLEYYEKKLDVLLGGKHGHG